jgi:hypothetical protein
MAAHLKVRPFQTLCPFKPCAMAAHLKVRSFKTSYIRVFQQTVEPTLARGEELRTQDWKANSTQNLTALEFFNRLSDPR